MLILRSLRLSYLLWIEVLPLKVMSKLGILGMRRGYYRHAIPQGRNLSGTHLADGHAHLHARHPAVDCLLCHQRLPCLLLLL